MIEIEGKIIITDKEGYIKNLSDWSPKVASCIARQEGVEMNAAHWEIVYLLREFFVEFDLSPAMRPLVKYTQQKLGQEKGKSVYLLKLFPGSPPKLAAKIAGLPRPENCL